MLLPYPSSSEVDAQPNPGVKLVLQITIDGLRGDLLNRYQHNFGKGGFRYLLDEGVVHTNAHYQHANTETIVGHTTLATGTYPAIHGMVGNVWYDRDTGELAYNIEDPRHPLLPSSETSSTSTNPVVQQVERNLYPTRSDDIYIAQEPYWFVFEKGPVVAMHGSPWRYDTHVPIIFAGAKTGSKSIYPLVRPVDVAPTIAAFLGMSPPSSSQGVVLREIPLDRPQK